MPYLGDLIPVTPIPGNHNLGTAGRLCGGLWDWLLEPTYAARLRCHLRDPVHLNRRNEYRRINALISKPAALLQWDPYSSRQGQCNVDCPDGHDEVLDFQLRAFI